MSLSQFWEPVNVLPYCGKKDFAFMIRVGDLGMERLPWILWMGQKLSSGGGA